MRKKTQPTKGKKVQLQDLIERLEKLLDKHELLVSHLSGKENGKCECPEQEIVRLGERVKPKKIEDLDFNSFDKMVLQTEFEKIKERKKIINEAMGRGLDLDTAEDLLHNKDRFEEWMEKELFTN